MICCKVAGLSGSAVAMVICCGGAWAIGCILLTTVDVNADPWDGARDVELCIGLSMVTLLYDVRGAS